MLKNNLNLRTILSDGCEAIEDYQVSEAEKANRAKTKFLSNMSHELRTPLNVIIGMCDIARHHIDDIGKVKDCLEKINKAGDHLIELVDSALDITRIEQGRELIKEQEINIDHFMNEIWTLLEALAADKSIMLDISARNVVNRRVLGDYGHMMQVIINLATNAIKYTPEGGFVKIWVEEKENDKKNKVTYEFICKDNGIGMSQDFIEHIFEPFARAEDSRVREINGVGLGMSIVNNIVKLLDGDIVIESCVGIGTTIKVRFDLELLKGQNLKEDINEFRLRELRKLEERRIILIAEDIQDNREVLETYLEDLGFEVECAENGEAVVDMFMASEEKFYRAIFMDIEMPVMDGYQATLMIRGLNRSDSNIPIIAMTANAFKDDRDEAARVGMDYYLTKPLKMERLEQIIHILD